MANTYTQIHIQFVFAVRFRAGLIKPAWKEQLHQYMKGIIQNNDHKLLQINIVPDHVHILVGFRPHQSISSFVQNLKSESTKWIKAQKFSQVYEWQQGYGAFSYSKSAVPAVIRYIQNQEAHHKKESFLSEYQRLLNAFGIEYDERYIFKEPV